MAPSAAACAFQGAARSSSKLIMKRTDLDEAGLFFGEVLFDLEIDESPTSTLPFVDCSQLEQDLQMVKTICSASSVQEDVLVRRIGRVLSAAKKGGAGGECTARAALESLEDLGFPVSLSTSRQKKGDPFRCPRHEFLKLATDDVAKGATIIIDCNFRSSFVVARSSYYYSKIVEELPEVFVGNEDRLRLLVAFMSEQLKRNFETTRMDCPPWRDTRSLLNTWAL